VNRAAQELRLFFVALQFLTRVPVPRWVGFEPDWLNQSARWFALVGTCVGGVAALVLWVASSVFPPAVAVGLSIISTLLLTGGFHEDGLADTADGLGLKAATLSAMPPLTAVAALLLAHTASRAAAVLLIRVLPYAGDIAHAKAKPLAQRVSGAGVMVALGTVATVSALLILLAPAHAPSVVTSLALVAIGAAWSMRWLRSRLGGYTGDTLGGTQQLTELLSLLGWLGASRWMV